ncbi:MAG: ERAP1-like C-terminal domain-containing protein, partial [Candidatus Kariarchaeaceae archaeon]
LRSSLLNSSYLFSDEGVAQFGKKKFKDYLDGNSVHPDILSTIMRIGAAQTPDSYPILKEKLEKEETPEPEKINLLQAISSFEDKELLLAALEYSLEKVPDRNKYIPIITAARNLAIAEDIWDWFKDNVEKLEKLNPMHFESVIAGIVGLSGLNRVEEVKTYFNSYMEKKDLAKDTIKMTLERMEINARLRRA